MAKTKKTKTTAKKRSKAKKAARAMPVRRSARRRAAVQPSKSARSRGRSIAEGGAEGARPEGIQIDQFFERVASGMVNAQTMLDQQSLKYLTSAESQPHVVPSVFRLPKVSADISFALEDVEKNGFSMLFFGDSTEATTRHQQSIHFDMVAAPPSPEYRSGPVVRLIVSPASRAPVLAAVTSPPWDATTIDDVLVLHLSDEHFLVAFPDPRANRLALMYVCTRPSAVSGTIRAAGPVPNDLQGLYDGLRKLVGR